MAPTVERQIELALSNYEPDSPVHAADRLQEIWLQFEPKSTAGIKAELRERQKTVGAPVAELKAIGKALGKRTKGAVAEYVPLAQLLWDEYGREGRVVAAMQLGAMELQEPERIVPLLRRMCRSCVTWEDADRLAMNALEPILRKEPLRWLPEVEEWLDDENKWVRRAGITAIGRLPMKHPEHTSVCVELTRGLLCDEDTEVKKSASFAIRLCARGETRPVLAFLEESVPPQDPEATWVLCDAVRSMTKKLKPEFASLVPRYEEWASDESLSARDRRSVQSALRALEKAAG